MMKLSYFYTHTHTHTHTHKQNVDALHIPTID